MSDRCDLVILGGGEHARVVIEAARSRPELWNVIGFLDPKPCPETAERMVLKRLGDDQEFIRSCDLFAHCHFILGMGSVGVSETRSRLVQRFSNAKWAKIIHANSDVSPSATVDEGAVILSGVIVNTGARVGKHCVLNTGSVIEHDVVLGAFSQIGPSVTIGGATIIGNESYLGLGCKVRDHVRIGHKVLVGMGSVVTRSIPDRETVLGVPARSKTSSDG